MKKILFLIVLVLILLIPSVLAQNCGITLLGTGGGDMTQVKDFFNAEELVDPIDYIYLSIQNKPFTLYAPTHLYPPLEWTLQPFETDVETHCYTDPRSNEQECFDNTYVNYPDDGSATSDFPSLFSTYNPYSCMVEFQAVKAGEYYVYVHEVNNPNNHDRLLVKIESIIKTRGFGHECLAVDTSSCGEIFSFGDIMAFESISAGDIVSYGRVHSFGNLTVGDLINPGVILSKDLAILPSALVTGVVTANSLILSTGAEISSLDPLNAVYVNDDLRVEGQIYGGLGDNLVKFNSDVQVGTPVDPMDLDVHGSTSLHEVQTLDNNGNPIDVTGSMDVYGDINVQNTQGIQLGGEMRYSWPEFDSIGIENLIRNPGFEDPDRTLAWNDWGSPSTREISFSATRIRHGGQSLHITASGGNQGVSQLISNLKTDGTEYQITGWVYVESGTPVVMIFDDDYNFEYAVPGSGWVRFNNTIIPDTSSITLYLGRSGIGSNGDYYFDSFMLEEGHIGNKFRSRYLDFQGDAEFNDLDAMGDLYVDNTLTANDGLVVLSDASISGTAAVTGRVDAGDADIAGDVRVTSDTGRLMGSVNLRRACDSASPRMYTDDNRNFVIEIGSGGSCAVGEPCVDASDCASGNCDGVTFRCI